MTDSLSIAVHAFASRVLMSVSVDETLLYLTRRWDPNKYPPVKRNVEEMAMKE